MKKFIWCSPHPNHYNTYNYENLATIPGIDLKVVYFKKVLSKYPWKTDFKSSLNISFLQESFLGIDWKFILNSITQKDVRYIVAGYNNRTMFLMLTIFMIINRPFYIVSDTPAPANNKGLKRKLRNLWVNWLYRKLTFYLVTGQPGIEALVKLGLERQKIINLPFPTNIEFFIPSPSFEIKDELIFLSSGRLDINHKGYDVAIKAFSKIQSSNYKIKYKIAGDGPDRKKIEDLITSLNCTNVELLGWLEPSELLNFYHSGHIFIHSSNRDPFPNAVLEAMACGLPVIGSDAAGSVLDRVQPGFNGFIHEKGNVGSLAEQLNKILSLQKEEIYRFSKNSRLTAEKWPVRYNVETFNNYLVKPNDAKA